MSSGLNQVPWSCKSVSLFGHWKRLLLSESEYDCFWCLTAMVSITRFSRILSCIWSHGISSQTCMEKTTQLHFTLLYELYSHWQHSSSATDLTPSPRGSLVFNTALPGPHDCFSHVNCALIHTTLLVWKLPESLCRHASWFGLYQWNIYSPQCLLLAVCMISWLTKNISPWAAYFASHSRP